ncbi:MAG TPA: choice-of-anchor B family protein [Bacteroidia bacterium]|jgi:choice-of-anchor B domain-containing protein|nr:choice-of-anchor B family protein [Bacteroidia bacterium]
MKLKLLSACLAVATILSAQNVNVKLRSQLEYPSGVSCSNICGYVDKTGKEYALVGTSKGISIVDISNPDSPSEVKAVNGPTSQWREIKVKGNYAYVTTEGGGGLQIVNLSSLPTASGITVKSWTGGTAGNLTSIHALHIDGNFVYLYGSKLFNGGPLVADISDPENPVYVGNYQDPAGGQTAYVHDGYVRNDTLYACHIYKGFMDIIDFKDKKNPKLLGSVTTPSKFTHNSWLNESGKVVFTTDEKSNSFLTSYDISDPSNIKLLDKIQSNPGSNSTVHNTHIIKVGNGQFAVTSWYRDGFTIVDVTRPANLIQVGNYDTYSGSGEGFNGDWGVFPYFPSGNIVVSNIEDGLYVFTPTYQQACYFEGTVTDSLTGKPINMASVTVKLIGSSSLSESTTVTGTYATGMPAPGGTYSVTYSATNYKTKVLAGVQLSSGVLTQKDVQLVPTTFGIFENKLDANLSAYPNPFTNEITISYELQNKLAPGSTIQLTDMLGKIVQELAIFEMKGNVYMSPELHAGIYFVRIVNGAAVSSPIKIIKTIE